MAFTPDEISEHLQSLEDYFWAFRRPPSDIRDQIREGQRIEGQSIELFFIRPDYLDHSKQVEESIAKIRYIRSTNKWKLFWKRADGKWHIYPDSPVTTSLKQALKVIHEDANYCFFG